MKTLAQINLKIDDEDTVVSLEVDESVYAALFSEETNVQHRSAHAVLALDVLDSCVSAIFSPDYLCDRDDSYDDDQEQPLSQGDQS